MSEQTVSGLGVFLMIKETTFVEGQNAGKERIYPPFLSFFCYYDHRQCLSSFKHDLLGPPV